MRLRIVQDDSPMNPRQWDNMGTMICFHRRYTLGDDHEFAVDDYSGWNELREGILKKFGKDSEILPLYLYDHSGITMNTTGFSCPWDSGQVGFIVASANDIRDTYGVKRLTAKQRRKAIDRLQCEVKTYDEYLTGEVYGYVLENDEGEEEDSCYGFFGRDPFTNGMADNLPEKYHDLLKAARAEI
jgi:hypothetical protein